MEPTTARTAETTAPDAPNARPKATPNAKTLAEIAEGAKATPAKATTSRSRAAKTPKGKTPKGKATAKTAAKTTAAKGKAAKTAAKTGPRLTGPTPERIELARTVAKLRKSGAKWNEVAAATGKAEPTLAKLRIDVRAGVFANVSPVAKRTPKDAF
jgi:hypothetical protein